MRFMMMHKNDVNTEAGLPPPKELIAKMGPFAESKELFGGFSVMELSGFDEAIAICRRYAEILGGTLEVDLRPVADT